jgi:hypothetical protein
VLAEHGLADSEVQALLDQGVVGEGWMVLRHYLPH